jgi:NTE family protein
MVDERYLWDGSLLSNTPFSEVLFASPAIDKEFYIVDVFPRDQQKIPGSMAEVWHRARDITFLDKADKIIQMASQRREHISLIRNMREIVSQITQDKNLDDNSRKKLAEIDEQFNKVMKDSSAVVRDIVRVTRSEKVHYILEDADFTRKRIHRLIEEGENDAKNALKTPNRQQEMQKSEHRPKEVEYKTSDNRYQMVT